MTSSFSPLHLTSGETIHGYLLLHRLGKGAMGTVWKVIDQYGNQFAMKILLKDDSEQQFIAESRATAHERFRREALALSKIRHPGVAGIVDMELDNDPAFIVTELINGENLNDDVIHNGAYSGEYLTILADRLASAIDAVHQAGIIHRDIKPTNVMVSSRGPVLVDFGIAMGNGERHVTRTGLVMGTPGFIAPEIVLNEVDANSLTDWWSFASVLAFAATGRSVFGTHPMLTILERETSGNADLRGLSPTLATAFRLALDPDRSKRMSTTQLLKIIHSASRAAQYQEVTTTLPFELNDNIHTPTMPHSPSNPRLQWSTQQPEHAEETTLIPPVTMPIQDSTVPDTHIIQRDDRSDSQESTQLFSSLEGLDDFIEEEDDDNTPDNSDNDQLTDVVEPNEEATQLLYEPRIAASNPDTSPTHPTPPDHFFDPEAPQEKIHISVTDDELVQHFSPSSRSSRPHGRFLSLILTIPLTILCIALPAWGAITALAFLWCVTACGFGVVAYNSHRPTTRIMSAASTTISAPIYLIKAFFKLIPSTILWALILIIMNSFSLLSSNATQHHGHLIGVTSLTIPYLVGSPRSSLGLIIGITSGLAWILSCYTRIGPQESKYGFDILSLALQRGYHHLRDADSSHDPDEDTVAHPVSAYFGIILWLFLIAFFAGSLTVFLSLPVVNWSPLITSIVS